MNKCTEGRFLKAVSQHEITVIRDDGVNRHIRFSRPNTICQSFDLLTWPSHLCYTGDMGTYVFSRIDDMFEFFRMDQSWHKEHPNQKLFTNFGYWSQKLLSVGVNEGYREFDQEAFKERVMKYFNKWKESEDRTEEQIEELFAAIEDEVLTCLDDGEHRAYQAVHDFNHAFWPSTDLCPFQFEDFFDGGGTERYTYHYIWGLYAIVWGIQQYDANKEK